MGAHHHRSQGQRFELRQADTGDFARMSQLEWIETNGVGGWASSTVAGVNTRRYHGLLVTASTPPTGRVVLLSKLHETLVVDGQRWDLGTTQYPGALHPQGHRYLCRFSRRLFPRFRYHAGGVRLTRTVVGTHGENTTLMDYRVSSPKKTTILELRPFVSGRDFHSLRQAGEVPPMSFHEASALFRSGPWEREQVLWISIPGARFEAAPDWHHNVEYLRELDRGLDFREDLWTPGIFSLDVSDGHRVRIVVSARKPERRAEALLGDEIRRRRALLRNLPTRDRITVPLIWPPISSSCAAGPAAASSPDTTGSRIGVGTP